MVLSENNCRVTFRSQNLASTKTALIGRVSDLLKKAFPHPSRLAKGVPPGLRDGNTIAYTLWSGNRLIGLAMRRPGYIGDGESGRNVSWFGSLCVDPEHRGLGVGRRLLSHVAASDKQWGRRCALSVPGSAPTIIGADLEDRELIQLRAMCLDLDYWKESRDESPRPYVLTTHHSPDQLHAIMGSSTAWGFGRSYSIHILESAPSWPFYYPFSSLRVEVDGYVCTFLLHCVDNIAHLLEVVSVARISRPINVLHCLMATLRGLGFSRLYMLVPYAGWIENIPAGAIAGSQVRALYVSDAVYSELSNGFRDDPQMSLVQTF